MINININKSDTQYIPQVSFQDNAEFSIKKLATLIVFLQSGYVSELVIELSKDILTDDQYRELSSYLKAVKLIGSSKPSTSDKELLEAAKKPAKLMEQE